MEPWPKTAMETHAFCLVVWVTNYLVITVDGIAVLPAVRVATGVEVCGKKIEILCHIYLEYL